MDIIYAFKAIFYNLTLCMSYTFDFGSYTFSLGSVIVGSMILSCSSAYFGNSSNFPAIKPTLRR